MPTGPRPPIPPGIARVAILGTTMGHAWAQVFYLQCAGTGITTNDVKAVADEISAIWNTNIAPLVPSTVVLTGVTVVFIPSVGNEVVYQGSYSHAGSAGGTQIADASACAVIQWKISAYYRGGHPRSYMSGLTTAEVTNGSDIASASASTIAAAWNTLRNTLNAFTTTNFSTITMGTLSYQTANAWRTTPVFRAFTSVACNLKLGSQRRRIHS